MTICIVILLIAWIQSALLQNHQNIIVFKCFNKYFIFILQNDFQEEMNVPETAFYSEPDQLSEKNLSTNSISCRSIAENFVTVFKGVQNDVFGLESTKYAKVGRAVTKKLSKMNTFEAAKVSQKIIEILCLYDENNPLNPNRVKMKNIEK